MNRFKTLTVTARYMLFSIGGLFFAFLFLGVTINNVVYAFENGINFALGLLTGCLVSAVRIIMMDKSINKTVEMEEKKAKNFFHLQFLIRYFLVIGYAVFLIIFKKYVGVYGGVLGLLCMQLSAYGANFALNRRTKKDAINK